MILPKHLPVSDNFQYTTTSKRTGVQTSVRKHVQIVVRTGHVRYLNLVLQFPYDQITLKLYLRVGPVLCVDDGIELRVLQPDQQGARLVTNKMEVQLAGVIESRVNNLPIPGWCIILEALVGQLNQDSAIFGFAVHGKKINVIPHKDGVLH